eukprot:257357-Rhodomonas_salina.1
MRPHHDTSAQAQLKQHSTKHARCRASVSGGRQTHTDTHPTTTKKKTQTEQIRRRKKGGGRKKNQAEQRNSERGKRAESARERERERARERERERERARERERERDLVGLGGGDPRLARDRVHDVLHVGPYALSTGHRVPRA